MKRILPIILALFLSAKVNAQLSANNVVVLKLTSLSGYGRVATVSLEEYATAGGTVVSSTNISNTGGGNDFYLPYGAVGNQWNGYINLSSDKQLITLYGYNTLPTSTGNTELPAVNAPNRTFVAINAAGNIKKVITDAHSLANVNRGAIAYSLGSGNYGVYLYGHGSGIKYATFDANATTPALSTAIPISALNTLSAKIYEDKLYATSQVAGANLGLNSFDTSLPTASATASQLLNLTDSHDFVTFNLGNNIKVMYVAVAAGSGATGSTADGVFKYYSNDNGSTWTAAGKVNGNSSTPADNGFRGLTGRLENNKISLYGVTSGNSQNSLVKIVDNVAYNAAISDANATVNILATAPSGSGFRGVAFTPGSIVTLPVSFNNLSAKLSGAGVNINWSTASETNNDHFEIEASIDGKTFKKIKTVATNNGNSSVAQSYQTYVAINDVAIVLAFPLLLVFVGFKSFSRRRRVAMLFIGMLALASSFVACQKESEALISETDQLGNSIINGQKKIYIRIKQVDKNGDFSYSDVVVAK